MTEDLLLDGVASLFEDDPWHRMRRPLGVIADLWNLDRLRDEPNRRHESRPLPSLPRPDARPFHVVVCLTDIDGIATTPAIMQILGLAGAGLESVRQAGWEMRLFVSFATTAIAEMARRRLDGIAGFATLLAETDLPVALAGTADLPVLKIPQHTRLGSGFGTWLLAALSVDSPDQTALTLTSEQGDPPPMMVLTRRANGGGTTTVTGQPNADIAAPATEKDFVADNPHMLALQPAAMDAADGLGSDAATTLTIVDGAVHLRIGAEGLEQASVITVNVERASGSQLLHARLHDRWPADGAALAALPAELIGQPAFRAVAVVTTTASRTSAVFEASYPPDQLPASAVTCYLNRGGAGNPMIRAFADGVGARMRYAEDEIGPRPGVPIVWGVLRGSDRVIAHAKSMDQYWFYVDHSYFSRGHMRNYRVTRNAYEAGRIRRRPDDRIKSLGVELNPWNKRGSVILVCPPTDYFMAAHGCATWLEDTLAYLRSVTDRPVEVRNKPQPGVPFEPLPTALARTHALVTHSSNVAVEAVVMGTPVFVSPMSAAASVGQTDLAAIETPVYPDREPWLAHLAYSQFSFEEIADGQAWRLLLESETVPFL